jgi:hypothetical protein
MIFEKAIDDATKMFLFDKRSQQQLHEMAEAADRGSLDRSLILLTQAAFAYYNAVEQPGSDLPLAIRSVRQLLQEAKTYREDRVFTTMALKLEVDVLLQSAALTYQESVKSSKTVPVMTEDDQRALSICETLLRNMPTNFNPLPTAWYSSLLPLFPTFRDDMIVFYSQRGRDHRSEPLGKILHQVRREMVVAAGIIQAKRFLTQHRVRAGNTHVMRHWLLSNCRDVLPKLEGSLPQALETVSDIALPKGITQDELDSAVHNVNAQIDASKSDKDIRKYTGSLLQLGIVNFLRDVPDEAIRGLVLTLRATKRISPEDKKIRQYRHEEFPDIPFMVGSSYLRLAMASRQQRGIDRTLIAKGQSGLLRSLVLQPQYHHAFVNLILCASLLSNPQLEEELMLLYLSRFDNDLGHLNGVSFRNMALVNHQNTFQTMTPEAVRMLLLAAFCGGGQLTKAKKMLQELKTLYVLSAHDHSAEYLDMYRNALRIKDAEFIADLEDAGVHSALLFYMAHAFTSRSLATAKHDTELSLDHAQLDQGIDLNAESLFFNPKNGSALRLVDTQVQILQYAMQRSEKRWEGISNSMGQRFQYYEDYLRQEKSYKLLKERLTNLNLGQLVPEIKVSTGTLSRMDGSISGEQRDRLRQRVRAT